MDRFPNRDRVLERLMAEGLFDRREPDHEHIAEMRANWLSVALTEWVLERVENVEGRVRVSSSSDVLARAKPFFLDGRPSCSIG